MSSCCWKAVLDLAARAGDQQRCATPCERPGFTRVRVPVCKFVARVVFDDVSPGAWNWMSRPVLY